MGDFDPERPMPSEGALAQEYGVSRITVRQALAALAMRGLIVRRKGKGTFVLARPMPFQTGSFHVLMEDPIPMGEDSQPKLIGTAWARAAKKIADALGLAEDSRVLRIEKMWAVAGMPFSYVVNYLTPDIGNKINTADLTRKTLLAIIEEDLAIRVAQAEQSIGAEIADTYLASVLNTRVGEPLLKVEHLIFDDNNTPLEWATIHYRGDRCSYNIRLQREDGDHWQSTTLLEVDKKNASL